MKGKFRRVSPEEMVFAFLIKASTDIDNGADETTLHDWRRNMLSVSFHFKLLESDEDRCGTQLP